MRLLLSTIGSRGDVQPLAALAVQLLGLGEEVRVCAPPDFREWIEGLGIPFVSIGPEVRSTAKRGTSAVIDRPTTEQMRQIAEATVATQFQVLPVAAEGCDVLVGGGALQISLRSLAEKNGVPYVYVSYCPVSLPSAHHAPPAWRGDLPASGAVDHTRLWAEDAMRWNDSWGVALNHHRSLAGLGPVGDVRSHIFSEEPWMAADPILAPWPGGAEQAVVQTGAWILPDQRPLPADLERFLEAGEPPIYFGFGSIRGPENLSQDMVTAARELGHRAILSRGWAELSLPDNGPDCLSLGEVNQQALFQRVGAVVHHGGAGTTTAAARAGRAQVVMPQHYDQPYWAARVEQLGIGRAVTSGAPTSTLTEALAGAMRPDVVRRAGSIADQVVTDGALSAAHRLVALAAGRSRREQIGSQA